MKNETIVNVPPNIRHYFEYTARSKGIDVNAVENSNFVSVDSGKVDAIISIIENLGYQVTEVIKH